MTIPDRCPKCGSHAIRDLTAYTKDCLLLDKVWECRDCCTELARVTVDPVTHEVTEHVIQEAADA